MASGVREPHKRPGLSRQCKQVNADTPEQVFDLFITGEMIDNIVQKTNAIITDYLNKHPRLQHSNKYTQFKHTTPLEIRALFGLIYICWKLQNFQS